MNSDHKTASFYAFQEAWYKVDSMYNLYAKSVGLNFTSVLVLQLLYDSQERYTQKGLCEKLGLPKQLINSIIKSFWELGYLELKEATDRRNKEIIFTDKGRKYALSIVKPLQDVELAAWDSFSAEEMSLLMSITQKYIDAFQNALNNTKSD